MPDILQNLSDFLHKYYQAGRQILVGYSGGPDSSALLHALCKVRFLPPAHLTIVHVDHSWREESSEEASRLKKFVESLGLHCIVERLEEGASPKNLEEQARLARMAIFQKTYRSLRAQALILAHQAGDQAETVIKRIFEGSHITALGAMQPVSPLGEMTVWRPLLRFPKKALLDYCHEHAIPYLLDRTNGDTRFLRARMRKDLLPFLEHSFGKNIESNLARLGQSCHETSDYLSSRVQPILDKILIKDNEIVIDLENIHPFEAKFVIRKIAQDLEICLGQQHLDHLVELLQKNGQSRRFMMNNAVFITTHGHLRIVLTNEKSEKKPAVV